MKLIKPSYEILEQKPGIEGIYEAIERAGRTCYKSTPKIEEFANLDISSLPEGMSIDELPVFKEHPEEFKQRAKELNLKVDYFKVNTSAKDFVDRMINSGHGAMLEHGTVYLYGTYDVSAIGSWYHSIGRKYSENKYSIVHTDGKMDFQGIYVTTNLRVLVENNWLDDLKYLCEPTEFHEKRVTVKFTTSNSIMREFTRHRSHSFAIESTRYCNYSKNKFNNELTFIQPYWFTHDCAKKYLNKLIILKCTPNDNYTSEENLFLTHLLDVEEKYMGLINLGLKAQEAREVLPLATKCDMVMTGFTSDWQHLFNLRTSIIAETGQPHPDMANLCDPLYKEFIERGYIK